MHSVTAKIIVLVSYISYPFPIIVSYSRPFSLCSLIQATSNYLRWPPLFLTRLVTPHETPVPIQGLPFVSFFAIFIHHQSLFFFLDPLETPRFLFFCPRHRCLGPAPPSTHYLGPVLVVESEGADSSLRQSQNGILALGFYPSLDFLLPSLILICLVLSYYTSPSL
ncbi:hypothetical protein EDB87DRAFT_1619731 [Lactarius vividus]|nr:hypothetical protein EDB87DRAFT_1619731 [Lactarius vividus]